MAERPEHWRFGPGSAHLEALRMGASRHALEAIASCQVNSADGPCGYCHNCGGMLPQTDQTWCPRCGCSDTDE